MNVFDNSFGRASDLRKNADRRREDRKCPKDRRIRADRRLNNISVEWIPFDEVYTHPSTRDAFCSINRNDKNTAPIPARCEKRPSLIKSWRINIFKRTQSTDIEERTITDRRTKNVKVPYNRRVRPDRRLNNISVQWITFE